MNRSIVLRLAASSLVLAGTAIGCTPTSQTRPAAISAHVPKRNDAASARAAAQAGALFAKARPQQAIARAEQAVALAPDNAERRALLGRLYLASGRFLSAEMALRDAVALDPANAGALLNLSLAQIALGEWGQARATLNDAAGRLPEPDRGLGLALAGQPDAAIVILEPAARAKDADAKTRQNLALSYALAGRWAEARAVAAQDVSPADLDARMIAWAAFSRPHAVWEQVASLLDVTPARDPGPPDHLALARAVSPVRAAMAAPPVPPVEAPVRVAAAAAPVAVAAAEPAAPPVFSTVPSAGPAMPLLYADRAAPKRSPSPRSGQRTAPPYAQDRAGQWTVQLGAFSSPARLDAVWSEMSGRMRLLANYAPSQSQRINMRRLAIAGIRTQPQAQALCRQIKARGGACFVRRMDGDAPVQMAMLARADGYATR